MYLTLGCSAPLCLNKNTKQTSKIREREREKRKKKRGGVGWRCLDNWLSPGPSQPCPLHQSETSHQTTKTILAYGSVNVSHEQNIYPYIIIAHTFQKQVVPSMLPLHQTAHKARRCWHHWPFRLTLQYQVLKNLNFYYNFFHKHRHEIKNTHIKLHNSKHQRQMTEGRTHHQAVIIP